MLRNLAVLRLLQSFQSFQILSFAKVNLCCWIREVISHSDQLPNKTKEKCPSGSCLKALADFAHSLQTCAVLCAADAFVSGNENTVGDYSAMLFILFHYTEAFVFSRHPCLYHFPPSVKWRNITLKFSKITRKLHSRAYYSAGTLHSP